MSLLEVRGLRAGYGIVEVLFGLDLDGLCLTPLDEAERRGPFDEWIALYSPRI